MDKDQATPQPIESSTTIIDNTPKADVTEPLNAEQNLKQVKGENTWFRVGFFLLLPILIFSLTGNAYFYYYMNHMDGTTTEKKNTKQADNGLNPPEGTPAVTDAPLTMQPDKSAPAATTAPANMDNWQSYENADPKFTIKFPPTWKKSENTAPEGAVSSITLDGPEGKIVLSSVNGLGSTCATETLDVAIKGETLKACVTAQEDGSEVYGQMEKGLPDGLGFVGDATVKNPVATNKPLVFTVLSTLEFRAGP